MKYKHYSPSAPVTLVDVAELMRPQDACGSSGRAAAADGGAPSAVRAALRRAADGSAVALLASGRARRVAVLRTSGAAGQATGWEEGGGGGGQSPRVSAAADGDGELLVYCLGSLDRPDVVASELFAALRAADEAGADAIVVEGVGEAQEGLAVMNRLRKAAAAVVTVPTEPGSESGM